MPEDRINRPTSAALALTWAVVVLPALWGLTYTVENVLKLFRNSAPAAVAPPASR